MHGVVDVDRRIVTAIVKLIAVTHASRQRVFHCYLFCSNANRPATGEVAPRFFPRANTFGAGHAAVGSAYLC